MKFHHKLKISVIAALIFCIGSSTAVKPLRAELNSFLPSQAVQIDKIKKDMPIKVICNDEEIVISFRIVELLKKVID